MFRHNRHPQAANTAVVKTCSNTIFYNNHAYQMCMFQLQFTVFKMLL